MSYQNQLKSGMKLMFLGTQFAITIVIGYYLGIYLDKEFETGNTFLLICSLTFAAIGFYQFVKQANRSLKDGNNKRNSI